MYYLVFGSTVLKSFFAFSTNNLGQILKMFKFKLFKFKKNV